MGYAGYSPSRSLGSQGPSPPLCYLQDPLQPADLGLRGRPGKSSPRPHPSSAPARPLSPTPPAPTPVVIASHRTPSAVHATREQIPGTESWISMNTREVSLLQAEARAGWLAPPLPTASGSHWRSALLSALGLAGNGNTFFLPLPPGPDPGEENSAPFRGL